MEKKALVLAGGEPQISLIQELKGRGYFVVLADYFENPVAKKYADKHCQVSTLDADQIKRLALQENVDFLITVCTDQALLTVAKVSSELGLPCYVSYETALLVTNKIRMKKVLYENNIPTARFELLTDGTLKSFNDSSLSFPLVVKPANCNSSKGVAKVCNKEELEEAVQIASQCSRTNEVLIEEFIDGLELSVEAYVENGTAHILTISCNEKISDQDKFVIFRERYHLSFVENNVSLLREIERVAQSVASAFHLVNSPLLIQLLTNGSKVFVIELSARTGGGFKYYIIKRLTGWDVIKTVVDLTLGNNPKFNVQPSSQKYVLAEYFYGKGIFDRLEGFDELLKEGSISKYAQYKSQGVELTGSNSSGDRIAGIVLASDSFEKLRRLRQETFSKAKVLDVCGVDIMNRNLPDLVDFEALLPQK